MNKIKTKSEQIPRPRPFLYKAKIEKHGRRAHNPKIYKFLYKIGLVIKGIKICTYSEERALYSEKDHKKVQKRKNRRKGVFWGAKFSKVKSIDGVSPRGI